MVKARKQQTFNLFVTDGVDILDEVQQKGFAFRDAANKAFTSKYPGYDKANLCIKEKNRVLYIVGPEFLGMNS